MAKKDEATKKAAKSKKDTKQKKSVLGPALGIFFLLLMIGGAYLYLNFEAFSKAFVEKQASKTLGTKVTIEALEIMPQELTVKVSGIHIANPHGYAKDDVLVVGGVKIAIESFQANPIVFKQVQIDDTNIDLEIKPSGTNMTDLVKGMDRKASDKGGKASSEKKIIIREFLLNNASVTATSEFLKSGEESVILPDLILKGIGEKKNGVVASEALAQIMDYVSQHAVKASAREGLLKGLSADSFKDIKGDWSALSGGEKGQMMDDIKDSLGKIDDKTKDAGSKLRSFFE